MIRLAVIGCGRAAESLHVPVAAFSDRVEVTALVDIDLERARSLAARYGVPDARTGIDALEDVADAAVVALPHHLHAPMTRSLLEAGLDVLVEKPLALDAAECDRLAELAATRGRVLAVGMIRRLFPAMQFVRDALARELLGALDRIEIREGVPYAWDVASDFGFRADTGGGVLFDIGIHVLDLLAWWFDAVAVEAYRDDAYGGVEAECEIELELGSRVPAVVELSRTRHLANVVRVVGERGTLTAETGFGGRVRLQLGDRVLHGRAGAEPAAGAGVEAPRTHENVRELFLEQLEDFAGAVRDRRHPLVSARSARRAVGVAEECRGMRQQLDLPWVAPPGAGTDPDRRGQASCDR